MALTLLDFTSGTVDLNVAIPGGSGTSMKCVLSDLMFRLSRTMQSRKTLCSGIWNQRTPSDQIGIIQATKQASSGAAYSDPLILMSDNLPHTITFTAFTGCTISGLFICTDDGLGGSAGSVAFAGGLAFENYGVLTSTWVVS